MPKEVGKLKKWNTKRTLLPSEFETTKVQFVAYGFLKIITDSNLKREKSVVIDGSQFKIFINN